MGTAWQRNTPIHEHELGLHQQPLRITQACVDLGPPTWDQVTYLGTVPRHAPTSRNTAS